MNRVSLASEAPVLSRDAYAAKISEEVMAEYPDAAPLPSGCTSAVFQAGKRTLMMSSLDLFSKQTKRNEVIVKLKRNGQVYYTGIMEVAIPGLFLRNMRTATLPGEFNFDEAMNANHDNVTDYQTNEQLGSNYDNGASSFGLTLFSLPLQSTSAYMLAQKIQHTFMSVPGTFTTAGPRQGEGFIAVHSIGVGTKTLNTILPSDPSHYAIFVANELPYEPNVDPRYSIVNDFFYGGTITSETITWEQPVTLWHTKPVNRPECTTANIIAFDPLLGKWWPFYPAC
jgi:hypothetical protein